MEDYFTIYIAALIISFLIFYFVIKSAVGAALKENQNDNKEVEKLLRSILIKLDGNLPEFAKIENALSSEFAEKKSILNKKIQSNRNYNTMVKDLENEILQKEYDLKSKL